MPTLCYNMAMSEENPRAENIRASLQHLQGTPSTQDSPTPTSDRTCWAHVSLAFFLIGCLLFALVFVRPGMLARWAYISWLISIGFGIAALVRIKRQRPRITGKTEAIIGITISAGAIVASPVLFIVLVIAVGMPWDYSHPESVIAMIEDNCDFTFPRTMESVKAADKFDDPPDPPYYLCKIRFATDPNGFAQLRQSLSELDHYSEVPPDEFAASYLMLYAEVDPNTVVHACSGQSKNKKMSLQAAFIVSEEPGKILVYIEGLGDPRFWKQR